MYSVEKQGRGPSVRQYQEAQVEGGGEYTAQNSFCKLSQVHTEYIFSWYKQFTRINLHQQYNQNKGRPNSKVTVKE